MSSFALNTYLFPPHNIMMHIGMSRSTTRWVGIYYIVRGYKYSITFYTHIEHVRALHRNRER